MDDRTLEFLSSLLWMAEEIGPTLDGHQARRLEVGPVGYVLKVRPDGDALRLVDWSTYNA